jgi:hypothetical protein
MEMWKKIGREGRRRGGKEGGTMKEDKEGERRGK